MPQSDYDRSGNLHISIGRREGVILGCVASPLEKSVDHSSNPKMIASHVTELKVLPGHRLELRFADGVSGVIDMSGENFQGALAPFADEFFFAQAIIRDGAVTWPNGVNLASDTLYAEVRNDRQRQIASGKSAKMRLGFLAGKFVVPDPATFSELGKDEIGKMFGKDD
jgi:Protein of unknown function (DUF2442)